jgi:flagellar hook protein FlgE
MGSALWAGISGLNASSKEMDVIANNLANVNTLGYKAGTTYFADVLSQSISGGSGTLQVGRGVAVAEVQTQFGSGSFETTGNSTDVAIDGDGFFMVNNTDGGTFYTRAGAFKMDANGLLVDTNGFSVQGHLIDATGTEGPLSDLNLQNAQNKASTTTTFALGTNLNSETVIGGQYSTTQTVYDEVGGQHTLTNTFTRTAHANGGFWNVQAQLDSTPATVQSEYGLMFDGTGAMTGIYTGAADAPLYGSTASTVGAVTQTAGVPPAAVTALVAGGLGLTVPDNITLTRGALATDPWTADAATLVNYPHMVITANAGTVTINADSTDAIAADITLTLSGTWEQNDTAAFSITTGPIAVGAATVTQAGTASATLDRPEMVYQTGTMKLTRDAATSSWIFAAAADKGGYTNATVTSAGTGLPVNISLDGSGTTDVHLTQLTAGWADGDTATFTLTDVPDAGATVTALNGVTLVRPGMVYQNGSIALKCDTAPPAAGTSWSVSSAQYTNARIIPSESTATVLHISLDGTGTNDLTINTSAAGTWAAGDTITIPLTHTESATGDITITFPSPLPGTVTNTLPSGATIGVGGVIDWNLQGDGALPITQYAAASVIRSLTADGFASGDLKSLSINEKGRISGYFTNGQTTDLAQLILARFHDPWGLKKMGSNLFGLTLTSGPAIQNAPGQAGMGSLSPNSVEMSNTDIATEFIRMITAQKAYQACARVVTTEDTLMQELMNLKR